MAFSVSRTSPVLERSPKIKGYPEAKVIVLDDQVNTFEHVVQALKVIIPGMTEDRAWKLARKIDKNGSAEVWRGPLEQAEL